MLMVFAAEPLNVDVVPVNPVPMVNEFVVFAVIVALPPRTMDDPFIVMELLDNFVFAIEPESIVFVTVPLSPVVTTVPVVAGSVKTVPVPATAVGVICIDPLVAPGSRIFPKMFSPVDFVS